MKFIYNEQLKHKLIQESLEVFPYSNKFIQRMQIAFIEKGEYLIHEGTPSEYLYIFVRGKLKVFANSLQGKSIVFAVFDKPKLIGEISSLWQSIPNTNVVATQDSYALIISLEEHRQTLQNDVDLLKFLCLSYQERILALDTHIMNHFTHSSDCRFAAYLYNNKNCMNELEINLSELASILSISYRHLLRIIEKFISENIIIKEKKSIKILDLERLETQCSELINLNL